MKIEKFQKISDHSEFFFCFTIHNKHERDFVLQVRCRDLNNSCEWCFQNLNSRQMTHTKVYENQVMQYEEYFQKWCDLTRFCLHLDSWHFLCWRNFGSILFVLQNSWHFQTVEEFRIYFIYTNQNWAPIFQIMTLFYFIDIFKVS